MVPSSGKDRIRLTNENSSSMTASRIRTDTTSLFFACVSRFAACPITGRDTKRDGYAVFCPPCIRFVYFYYVCTACEQQNQPSASHSDFWSDVAIRCSPMDRYRKFIFRLCFKIRCFCCYDRTDLTQPFIHCWQAVRAEVHY